MIINFPTREYTLAKRQEDYIRSMFYAVASAATELNINLEEHEWSGAVFSTIRKLINEHLGIEHDSKGLGQSLEEIEAYLGG